jgi:hypothetical protein
MSSSIGVLNYFAFFTLYIICFVFIYQKFSELIGFSILIVVNLAFLLFVLNDIMSIFQRSIYFVPMIACFGVIVGVVLHSVVLIFILMMSNNLQAKYTKKYGAPITLPKKYQNKMEIIKRLMIASFCLGSIILYSLFYNYDNLKHNFLAMLKDFGLKSLYQHKEIFVTLGASLALMGISGKQVFDANEFSKLSRQQLMDEPAK